jgi:hypothetical protein
MWDADTSTLTLKNMIIVGTDKLQSALSEFREGKTSASSMRA